MTFACVMPVVVARLRQNSQFALLMPPTVPVAGVRSMRLRKPVDLLPAVSGAVRVDVAGQAVRHAPLGVGDPRLQQRNRALPAAVLPALASRLIVTATATCL